MRYFRFTGSPIFSQGLGDYQCVALLFLPVVTGEIPIYKIPNSKVQRARGELVVFRIPHGVLNLGWGIYFAGSG